MVQYTNKWLTDHLLQKQHLDASLAVYMTKAGGNMVGNLDVSTADASLIIRGFNDASTFLRSSSLVLIPKAMKNSPICI